jgi:hypothetical protein
MISLSICKPPFFIVPNPDALPSDRDCHRLLNTQSASQPIVNVTRKYSVKSRPLFDRFFFAADHQHRLSEVAATRVAPAFRFPSAA